MKTLCKKHKELLVLVALLLILVVLPLSVLELPSGHDYKYHMGRIYQISVNISRGEWFSPIYFEQLNGHGYASPLFYGDVFLHIPGAAVAIGMSVEAALRLYIMLCLCASALVMFFCMKRLTGSAYASLVSAVLYTFSSYLAVDAVTRVALGEVQAFVFLPIAYSGLYSILVGDKKDWLMLPLGLVGVLISHTLSAAALAFFFLVLALFYLPSLWREKSRIGLIAASALIFFALSAFYTLPMLEQLAFAPLRLTDGTADTIWGTMSQRSMSLWQAFSDFNLSHSNEPWIPNGIGLAIPLAAVAAIVLSIKNKLHSIAVVCSFLTLAAIFAVTSLFPWDLLQSTLGKLQFPWRLFMFAVLFGAICAGFTLKNAEKGSTLRALSVVMITLSLFSFCYTASPKIKTMISNAQNGTQLVENWHDGLGGAEYLPSDTPYSTMLKVGAVAATNDKGIRDSLAVVRDFDVTVVSFTGTAAEDADIRLPLVMYKGYEAYDQNGSPVALTCERGYVIAQVGGIVDGVITVKYVKTSIQIVSKIISLLTFVGLIIYIIIKKIRKTSPTRCQSSSLPQANAV